MESRMIIFAIVFMSICSQTYSQNAAQSFCLKDARPEVVAFCVDLMQFQSDVNAKNTAAYTDDLNQLDLSNRRAVGKAIPALSQATLGQLAASGLSGLPAGIVQSPVQQSEATSATSGTTSLVTKAGSASILSLALDTGAVTQSTNGTSSTVTTNAEQIFRLVTNTNPTCVVNCRNVSWFDQHVLSMTNIAATFALAQQSTTVTATSGQASGTTATPVASASVPQGAGKLSGINAKFEILDKFNPRSAKFQQNWKTSVQNSPTIKSAVTAVGSATDPVAIALTGLATPLNRAAITAAAESDPTGAALCTSFSGYFKGNETVASNNQPLAISIAAVMQARSSYRDAWYDTLDAAAGTLLSIQYAYNKPQNQPNTHDITFIGGYNSSTWGTLTFNGAISLYSGLLPAGAQYGRVHDGQISAEYDQTFSKSNASIQKQLTLAGYWQYQPNPSVLNIPAGTVAPGTNIPLPNGTQEFVGTAGSLWVTQAKLTIKGAGGLNIPLGVSWSNKTDLLQGSKVGGQIGISYNISSLGQLFGSSH